MSLFGTVLTLRHTSGASAAQARREAVERWLPAAERKTAMTLELIHVEEQVTKIDGEQQDLKSKIAATEVEFQGLEEGGTKEGTERDRLEAELNELREAQLQGLRRLRPFADRVRELRADIDSRGGKGDLWEGLVPRELEDHVETLLTKMEGQTSRDATLALMKAFTAATRDYIRTGRAERPDAYTAPARPPSK